MYEQIELRKVTNALGLQLGTRSYSLLDFNDDITRGFPVWTVEILRKAIAPDMRSFAGLIASEATLKRRRRKPILRLEKGDRLWKAARVLLSAETILGRRDKASDGFQRPCKALGGRKPVVLVST